VPALSTSEAIGDRVKAALDAEGFTYGTPPAPVSVVKRKFPVNPAGKSALELVVVVGEESRSEEMDARHKFETYTTAVVLVTPTGHKTLDDAAPRVIRDRVKQLVDDLDFRTFATLTASARINKATFTGGKPPFDPQALAKDLNWSALVFDVQVIQTRATS
jgi:hypothetical protein